MNNHKMVSQIEPYLKTGLSIRKAVREAKISRATFYRHMSQDVQFKEQIERFCNFSSVMINNALFQHLLKIIELQNGNTREQIPAKKLKKDDIKFLKWYVMKTKTSKEEFGRPKFNNFIDPTNEIQKIKKLLKN